jgi:hypothetical protein
MMRSNAMMCLIAGIMLQGSAVVAQAAQADASGQTAVEFCAAQSPAPTLSDTASGMLTDTACAASIEAPAAIAQQPAVAASVMPYTTGEGTQASTAVPLSDEELASLQADEARSPELLAHAGAGRYSPQGVMISFTLIGALIGSFSGSAAGVVAGGAVGLLLGYVLSH